MNKIIIEKIDFAINITILKKFFFMWIPFMRLTRWGDYLDKDNADRIESLKEFYKIKPINVIFYRYGNLDQNRKDSKQ